MTRHNYSLSISGAPDFEQVGKNLDSLSCNFYKKGKTFMGSPAGLAEYIRWLKSIPDDSVLAKYKAEIPEMEEKHRKMAEVQKCKKAQKLCWPAWQRWPG